MKKTIKEKTKEEKQEKLETTPLTTTIETPKVVSEKEKLQTLYQTLKDLGINSIGDLEVKISRL